MIYYVIWGLYIYTIIDLLLLLRVMPQIIDNLNNTNKRTYKRDTKGYIYLIYHAPNPLCVKLGKSTNPYKRLKTHQTATPFGLGVISFFKHKNITYSESILKTYFKHCNIRYLFSLANISLNNGVEWYFLTPSMLLLFSLFDSSDDYYTIFKS